jgi:multicomponent K+:H+ antiporter subunit A
VRLVLPVSWVIAIYLLLRGHNEPGGGFIAGLVVSIGFIVQYMVAGTLWVEAHMKLRPPRWIAVGQLLAVTTGLGAVLVGYPFLTSHTAHFRLPVIGEVHLPSAMFFDMGIFAVVVGSTMLILTALAHQSLRSRRPARQTKPAAVEGPEDPDPRALVAGEELA